MKAIFFSIGAILLSAVGAQAGSIIINNGVIYNDCIKGNGKNISETRQLTDFDSVEVDGAFQVNIISQAKSQGFTISGEANIIPHIKSKVSGKKLRIYPSKNICPSTELTIDIATRNIKELTANGADDVNVSRLDNKRFNIELNGSGDMVLAGQTNKLTAVISGSGDIKARELKAKNVKIEVSGAGDVIVYASDSLQVEINGASDVQYYGNPAKVNHEINGAGELEAM